MTDPRLDLTYDFQPSPDWDLIPGQIIVSVDPQNTVSNTLRFSIRNPMDQPVLNLTNKDDLTPASDLPPISHAQGWPKPLDRIYLRFPWCTQAPVQCSGKLTTMGYADAIRCQPDEQTAAKWYTQRLSDPTYGFYWILFPKDKTVQIGAGESIQFVIDGIVTFINAGTTTAIYIKPNVAGYDETDDAVASIFLTNPAPQAKLNATADNVPAGSDVKLVWKTLNARTCTLSPIEGGNKTVPTQMPDGFLVQPLASTTYTLLASNALGMQTPATTAVNVQDVSIGSFTAEPAVVREGDPVKLSWTTNSAVTCEIEPNVGTVCVQAKGCSPGTTSVRPVGYTQYTLTASGQGLPQKRIVSLLPLRVGWSQIYDDAPWLTSARPVTLLFGVPGESPWMWLLAAGTGTMNNPVFRSRGGSLWATATNSAAFSQRGNSGGAVFLGKMWLLGGRTDTSSLNDIWSSPDGVTWTQVSPTGAIWSPRSDFGCVVFAGKLWILGGRDASGQPLQDLWCTADGITWTQSGSAQWTARSAFGVALFGVRLWILGGLTGTGVVNEVWSSGDGVSWIQENNGTWSARSSPCVQVIRNRLFLCGGTSANGTGLNSLYYLEASGAWINTQGPPWKGNPINVSSTQYLDALWLLGGGKSDSKEPLALSDDPAGLLATNRQVWVYAPAL